MKELDYPPNFWGRVYWDFLDFPKKFWCLRADPLWDPGGGAGGAGGAGV